jgi:hypothetical protein
MMMMMLLPRRALLQDVQEFHPYVFQVFAQLIELRAAPLPAVYLQVRAVRGVIPSTVKDVL